MKIDQAIQGILFIVKSLISLFYCYALLIFKGTSPVRSNPQNKKIDLKSLRRVVVIRLDKIGDVVMTTPFLRELRRNLPEAHITLLVNSMVYELMKHCPYVNEVVDFGTLEQGALSLIKSPIKSFMLSRHLRKSHYDLAIVPRWDTDFHQAVFTAYLSGATWRVGYSERVIAHKAWNNKGCDRLLTHRIYDSSLKHEVERGLGMITYLGGNVENNKLELWSQPEDELSVDKILEGLGDKNCVVFAICPGAAVRKREWPVANYIELGKRLMHSYRCKIGIIGGKKDLALGKGLKRQLGNQAINLMNAMTLRQTYTFLKRSQLYIGSDTGPMHLAAAANIPVLGIFCHPKSGTVFSDNAPERVGPWTERTAVLQPTLPLLPCTLQCNAAFSHCITQITVTQVQDSVRQLLAR